MKFFKKDEIAVVSFVLVVLFVISFFNFRVALRRSRDAQRRADLADVSNALDRFHKDFGKFPFASEDGKIIACEPDNFDELVVQFRENSQFKFSDYLKELGDCRWGDDSLRDLTDDAHEPYLKSIPKDPRFADGLSYYYLSNGDLYQIYAYLEGEEAALGYNGGVVQRKLPCGNEICSYGKTFGKLPLDKSIEEYENELLRENK